MLEDASLYNYGSFYNGEICYNSQLKQKQTKKQDKNIIIT